MFHRLADAWIRHGPKQFVRLALKNVAALPKSAKHRALGQSGEFDRNLGIETDDIRTIGSLDLDPRSESTRNAVCYEPSGVSVFERALASVPIDPREFSFVDYGSGKGRVLILAARLPFQRVIGVEFSQSLHQIAQDNVRLATGRAHFACPDVRSICCDALEFAPPEGPQLCYFYNPFGPPIMERVLDRLSQSLAQSPRPIFIVYVNPVHRAVVAANNAFQLVESTPEFCIFRSKLD